MKQQPGFATVFAVVSLLSVFVVCVRAEDPAGWSTIKGQVVFAAGEIPKAQALVVNKDMVHCLAKGPILSEDWVINPKNRGVRWTFLWLAPEPPVQGKSLPIHPQLKNVKDKEVFLDQPCCAFIPHCLAIREGQDLIVKNSAPVPHNINWAGNPLKNPGGNVIIPAGQTHTIAGLKADRLPLQMSCNIHPWMKGRLAVFDHPYFAVTDENGNFAIPLAPAGEYRLKVYHESVGWRGGAAGRDGEKITIKPNGVTNLGKIELKANYE